MAADTPTRLDWQLGREFGTIAQGANDIMLCLLNILTTRKGSDPHRPRFGSDIFEHLGLPITQAAPRVAAAITEAVRIWEERIVLTAVPYVFEKQPGSDTASVAVFTLSWRLVGLGDIAGELDISIGDPIAPDQPVTVRRILATEAGVPIATDLNQLIEI